jgi:hypothetical protein
MRLQKTLASLTRNRISLVGSVVVQVSAVLLVTLFVLEMLGIAGNPYIGALTYMLLPALLMFGVVLIIWGIRRERKRVSDVEFPVVDFNQEHVRKRWMWLLLMATVGTVIVAVAGSSAVHYMESNAFCGEVCHTPMTPEFTAHARSSHARVKCTQCHVGTGTDWFVKSKLAGMRQLISTTLGTFNRPISTPVHGLRPSKGTCETCHWPAKFLGSPAKMITRFSEDETNTETKTILIMKVGGHDFNETSGIHWHMDDGIEIRYRANHSRTTMYEVELTREDGSVTRYNSLSDEAPEGEETEWRTMDCVDCHNRPTHVYYGPDEAIDLALERGFISRDLPYLKREGMRIIQETYGSHDEARAGISGAIGAFYGAEYPDLAEERQDDIEEAGRILGKLYAANVFPSMKLGWNNYPNHIGHERSPGCYRCHEGNHENEDGEEITSDCEPCHTVVAWDEANPQILELLKD